MLAAMTEMKVQRYGIFRCQVLKVVKEEEGATTLDVRPIKRTLPP